MTAPFNSNLTRSDIVVDARLQQMLAQQSLARPRRREFASPQRSEVRVLSITITEG